MPPSLSKICPRCGTRFDASATFCARDGAKLNALDAPSDPIVGRTILDHFRVDALIGEGGMGVVYRAHDLVVDRDVAIKVLHPELAVSEAALRRFEREARIAGALDHPNVVRAFLAGQLPDGALYLVMELLRGRTLADLLRIEPVLLLPRALHILIQTAEGVGAAHEQGVVHRDVKPENVFLVTKGRDPDVVKVLDFGIARRFGPDEAIQLTAAGLVLGTALYISPEGAAGMATDARSDVYSIGVLAFRMLTGRTPFDADSPAGLLVKHMQQPPPPVVAPAGMPPVPAPIAHVVLRCLSKSPAERPADANELAQALHEAAAASGIEWGRPRTGTYGAPSAAFAPATAGSAAERASIPTDEPPIEARPSALVLAVSFVIGVLLVVGVWVVWPHGSSEPSAAQVRAESLKRAEHALAERQWDGPESVAATTAAILAERPDDPDALRIRRMAATDLVEEGDRERAAGHADVARARYDAALALLVGDGGESERIESLVRAPPPLPGEGITVAPEPVVGTAVLITATTLESTPVVDPRFVLVRDGRRVGAPIAAVPTGEGHTFLATFTFTTPGSFVVEFRVGHDTAAYAFRTTVTVSPGRAAPPPSSPVTTQG